MKIVSLPCSYDNYSYLLVCEQTGEAAIVDPAEFYPVYKEIERSNISLRAVYCTHHHADHIGGLDDLIAECPGLSIFGHGRDKRRIHGLNQTVAEGDRVRVGNVEGRVIHTPGHTSGSVSYLFGDALFTGDTLFGAGCGRLFEGSPEQMYHSLNGQIKLLDPATKVYFGHEYTIQNLRFASFVEPENEAVKNRLDAAIVAREEGRLTTPSNLGLELQTNPFLRCEEETIRESVAERFAAENLDPVSVFGELRRLKDSF